MSRMIIVKFLDMIRDDAGVDLAFDRVLQYPPALQFTILFMNLSSVDTIFHCFVKLLLNSSC